VGEYYRLLQISRARQRYGIGRDKGRQESEEKTRVDDGNSQGSGVKAERRHHAKTN
jgi:hypothetical protein